MVAELKATAYFDLNFFLKFFSKSLTYFPPKNSWFADALKPESSPDFKILIATILMCFFLYFGLEYFEDKLKYTYNFKLIYLLIMIGLSAGIYLLVANLFGILKLMNYKLK